MFKKNNQWIRNLNSVLKYCLLGISLILSLNIKMKTDIGIQDIRGNIKLHMQMSAFENYETYVPCQFKLKHSYTFCKFK